MTLPTSRAGWAGVRVVVHGFDAAGAAAADNLLFLGADVVVLGEESPDDPDDGERAELLRTLGADIRLAPGATASLPAQCDLVIAGTFLGEGPLEEQADARGVPVWSDAELAWRLRAEGAPPWLVAAGGDVIRDGVNALGTMLLVELMVEAAGVPFQPTVGGVPLVEVVMDPELHLDVVPAALTAGQLARSTSIQPEAAVVLVGDEPVLARAYDGTQVACIYLDDATEQFVRDAEVQEGARAIGITLDMPAVSMLGVVDDILVDRAFIAQRQTSAAELATLADFGGARVYPTHIQQALAAAALARAHGLSQQAVRDGIRVFHRPVDSSGDD